MAKGGAVSKGQPVVVGERGAELFIPNQTGQITQSARGTNGGQTTVNFNINTLDASGFDELLIRNRGTITSIINSAVNERGKKLNLMSGAFPISNAKFESLGIKSTQNTIISKSQSGKKLARQIDGQRFGFC